MKHLGITLTASSPLAIRTDHAPGGVESAPYIPGTTLLGSLAAAHRLLHNERTKEFEQLFLSDKIQYPHLYPAAFEDIAIENALLPVYPVPITAQTCKRHKGFRSSNSHGVRDTLLDWAAYKIMGGGSPDLVALEVFRQHKECPNCHAAMAHFDGYYRRQRQKPHHLFSAIVNDNKRLRTHTGINRERGSVEESILYSRLVFEEDMHFWGEVKLPEDEQLIGTFMQFMNEAGSEGWVRIGTGRSRGMGKVTFSMKADDSGESFTTFKKRLRQFDRVLKEHVREQATKEGNQVTHADPVRLASFYIALTLHSPLILCDERLRYYGSLGGDVLAREMDLSTSPFKRIYQAASTRRVMGWNELWGLPRAYEYAIETGSVFLYECMADLDNALFQALYRLEEEGMGRRVAEGFGRICFSDPFHLEVNLR